MNRIKILIEFNSFRYLISSEENSDRFVVKQKSLSIYDDSAEFDETFHFDNYSLMFDWLSKEISEMRKQIELDNERIKT